MSQPGPIFDLFAGPGGWSYGIRTRLGLEDVGVELAADVCATRSAAGLATIRADASQLPLVGDAWGLIASPPCPDFSASGQRAGRDGKSGWLIDVVPAAVEAFSPEWIACEQVEGALSIWHEHAAAYQRQGYNVWVGILNAADYGLPQARRRAILIASRSRQVGPPPPTHARGGSLFLPPWITAGEALGLEGSPEGASAAPVLVNGWPHLPGTVSLQRRQNGAPPVCLLTRPAPTLTASATARSVWVVVDTRTERPEPRWLSPAEALTLQGFPADYPLAGATKASREGQIGDAVPPPLAAAIVAEATGMALR